MLTDRLMILSPLPVPDKDLSVGTRDAELVYKGIGPVPEITVLELDGVRKLCLVRLVGTVVPTLEGVRIDDLKEGTRVAVLDEVVLLEGDKIGTFGIPFGLTGREVARIDSLEGVCIADGTRRPWTFKELRLVFGCGKAGKAEVGGSCGGCDGRGRVVVAIVEDSQGCSTSAELSTQEASGGDDKERRRSKRVMIPCLHELSHKVLADADAASPVFHLTCLKLGLFVGSRWEVWRVKGSIYWQKK